MESQNELIRKWLESGKRITPLEALHEFSCFRLSARIYDLRQKGMRILARTKPIMAGGKTKYITEYNVTKDT